MISRAVEELMAGVVSDKRVFCLRASVHLDNASSSFLISLKGASPSVNALDLLAIVRKFCFFSLAISLSPFHHFIIHPLNSLYQHQRLQRARERKVGKRRCIRLPLFSYFSDCSPTSPSEVHDASFFPFCLNNFLHCVLPNSSISCAVKL